MVESPILTTAERTALRVNSNIFLNVGAGLLSSLVIYVATTGTAQVAGNWGWILFLILVIGFTFEAGRTLAYKALQERIAMDIKWFLLSGIFAVVASMYVRAMRRHAHATYAEILFPWGQRSKSETLKPPQPNPTKSMPARDVF
jgi:hypothetical protein